MAGKTRQTGSQARAPQTEHHTRDGALFRVGRGRRALLRRLFAFLRHAVRVPDEALDRPPAPRIHGPRPAIRHADDGDAQCLRARPQRLQHPLRVRPLRLRHGVRAKQARHVRKHLHRSSRRLKPNCARRSPNGTRLDERSTPRTSTCRRASTRPAAGCNNIPSIQPVINQQLTLLTASYGMRIHPFYRTLQSHQGVDYTVPEGSRVFATADGTGARGGRNSTRDRPW